MTASVVAAGAAVAVVAMAGAATGVAAKDRLAPNRPAAIQRAEINDFMWEPFKGDG